LTELKGIRGWPEGERPRERLFKNGPHSLTDAELLAVILRTGVRGKSAVDLGRDTIKKYASLRALSRRDAGELNKDAGFGPAKAAAIVSAFELGRRAASENEVPHPRFRSSADVASHFLPLTRGLKREVFRVVMLDSAHRIMANKIITVGTLNLAVVHPREAFREAIIQSAAALVLMHNHPSGDHPIRRGYPADPPVHPGRGGPGNPRAGPCHPGGRPALLFCRLKKNGRVMVISV